jgi:hypothetical protein
VLTYQPQDMLTPLTQYTAAVSAAGQELVSGSWGPARRLDGTPVQQNISSTFTTGTSPDTIPSRVVTYSYPLDRQRFFLQAECDRGLIQLHEGMPSIFADRPGYSTALVARFVPTFGGASVESAARYDASSRSVSFTVPRITNNMVYALQIVRRERKIGGVSVSTGPALRGGAALPAATMSLSRLYQRDDVTLNVRKVQLPGTAVNPGEKLLYVYWFKTSQFDRLSQKITAMRSSATESSPPLGNFELLTPRFSAPEFFDAYDLNGTWLSDGGRLVPLVRLDARRRVDPWHTAFANPSVYDQIAHLRDLRLWGGQVQFERYVSAGNRGLTPVLAQFMQDPVPLLGDWERGPAAPATGVSRGAVMPSGMSPFGAAPSGMTPRMGTVTAPTVAIEYHHGIVVPFDWATLKSRAAWILATYGLEFLSGAERDRIQRMVSTPYQRFTHGMYTLDFWYGYPGCQNPDVPTSVSSARFTY